MSAGTPHPRPTVYVVAVNPRDLELPFIRPHIERLPAQTVAIHGYLPETGGAPLLPQGPLQRLLRKAQRAVQRQPWEHEIAMAYLRAFSQRPAAVLAEFGPTAVRLLEPCRRTGLPLIAHFHGYDTSVHDVMEEHAEGYRQVFRESITFMIEDPRTITRALELVLVARNLERVADLATNIAEEVVFIAEARIIKHHADDPRPRPKHVERELRRP